MALGFRAVNSKRTSYSIATKREALELVDLGKK
jgi:hypothetical protein